MRNFEELEAPPPSLEDRIRFHQSRIQREMRTLSIHQRTRGKERPCIATDGTHYWIFKSVSAAARAIGTSRADNICCAIRNNWHCKGLKWIYKNEFWRHYKGQWRHRIKGTPEQLQALTKEPAELATA